MKIYVVGIGYVGLSSSILLAQQNNVTAVDINPQKVDKINNRLSPIDDAECIEFLKQNHLNLNSIMLKDANLAEADYIVLSTPTNYDESTKTFDTSSLQNLVKQILKDNNHGYIVIKSTVPVGFTKQLSEQYDTDRILFSPEFLRESKALYDNLYPSRIIIGTTSTNEKTLKAASKFAQLLNEGAKKSNIDTLIIDSTEAEAIKLFSNTYLALRVAFFNEVDAFAETNDLNASRLIKGICLEPRIGDFYNNPSFGYGGYCLPKDTKQLLAHYQNIPNDIIRSVVTANKTRKDFIAKKIYEKVKAIEKPVVGIYRLVMKSNSDNFRESATIGIMKRLNKLEVNIVVYEPLLTTSADIMQDCNLVKDLNDFKHCSDLIIANRYSYELDDVKHKVYTRDCFQRD